MNALRDDPSLLVVAGEESGDLHASRLCEQIVAEAGYPIQLWGSGGRGLAALGARLLASSHHLGAIGPVAAIGQLGSYYRLYRLILAQAAIRRPCVVVLVDFPDFNLPLARALRRRKIGPIVCYVSPQLWAWRQGRVAQIRRSIDKMIVLFPFEVDFYRAHGITAEYYGHPLASRPAPLRDRRGFALRHQLDERDLLVAVLPGSRKREVESILPVVLRGAGLLSEAEKRNLQLVVVAAHNMRSQIEEQVRTFGPRFKLKILEGSEEAMANCDFGLIKSGTSTLEAALAGIPFCMLYRGSSVSWHLIRRLLKTRFFALPNLVLGEGAVPELVQRQATPRAVAEMLASFVRKDPKWDVVVEKLSRVKSMLAATDPYGNAAKSVVRLMEGCA